MWQILIHADKNWTIDDWKTRTKLGKQNLSNKNKVHKPGRFNSMYIKESKRQFSRSWNSLMGVLKKRDRERERENLVLQWCWEGLEDKDRRSGKTERWEVDNNDDAILSISVSLWQNQFLFSYGVCKCNLRRTWETRTCGGRWLFR